MPIIAKGSDEQYTLHPAVLAQAVCVDVVDLGMVETTDFHNNPTKTHKVQLIWESEELDEQSKPIQLRRRYTLSLNKKASLRRDLESWRGRPFNELELQGFDLEKLIGINCFVNIIHEKREDKTYANVASISPIRKGTTALIKSSGYVRVKDRPQSDTPVAAAPPTPALVSQPRNAPPAPSPSQLADDFDTVPF